MSKVLILMGSDSDFEQLKPAWTILSELNIESEVRVSSAHRTPDVVHELATKARENGFGVIIAAAGGAAHLAGVCAALSTLPVVAMPIANGSIGGMDALLSSVQMPPGIPLASVGIAGARNAGLFAAAILGAQDPTVAKALADYRTRLHNKVTAADARVRASFAE